jgi:hypothetical protein
MGTCEDVSEFGMWFDGGKVTPINEKEMKNTQYCRLRCVK